MKLVFPGRLAWIGWALLLVASVLLWWLNARLFERERTAGGDIWYMWLEGERLTDGVNPYERTLTGDMRQNNKYATYMPTIYAGFAGSYLAGCTRFETFLKPWRRVCTLIAIGIGALLYGYVQPRRGSAVALLIAVLWMFNRWTLFCLYHALVDSLAMLPLLASLMLLKRHLSVSSLLFGLSLSIKHLALFLAPLYLIWAWQQGETRRALAVLKAGALMALVPLLASAPFFVWHAESYLCSLLFSGTRNAPQSATGLASLDARLGLVGLPAKLPMLVPLCLIYVAVWQGRLGRFAAASAAIGVFVLGNSVFFDQYMLWLVPLVPLALLDDVRPAAAQPESSPGPSFEAWSRAA